MPKMPSISESEVEEALKYSELPEARASVTYNLTSKDGYGLLLTFRSQNYEEMFEMMKETEVRLKEEGYAPEVRKSFGSSKPSQTIVEGEKCPKCGAPVVKFVVKNKQRPDGTIGDRPAIKCSTSKYDFMTKTSSGCDYFKYADVVEEPATAAQMAILKEKGLWEEGMSKSKASEAISRVIGK